jgi:5-methylcytosine-specific restriction endonuclease McrA
VPSKGWPNGSTGAWRKTRLEVLNRDRWTCRICGKPINRALKFPHRGSASVHHTKGRRHGDDPRFLVAAHLGCNWDIGDPERGGASLDPEPVPRTAW